MENEKNSCPLRGAPHSVNLIQAENKDPRITTVATLEQKHVQINRW